MTPRERVLAMGVGAALVVAIGSYGVNSVRKGFQIKHDQIEQLETKILSQESAITDGLLNRKKIELVSSRSLPSDSERAQADYTEWLIGLVKSSGMNAPKWSFNPRDIAEQGVYRRYGFSVSGSGTIESLNRLLYNFYEKDYLHRITTMKITPVLNVPYQLNIQLSGEVLALDAASSKQASPDWISPRVAGKSMEDYRKILTQRNIFSPANHIPDWSATATAQATKGVPFMYSPKAKDQDSGQVLRYELLSDAPKGMQFSKEGDKLSWTPSELGKVEVELLVYDSGIPQGWNTQKLTIEVVDPPPPEQPAKAPPKFDIASQAEVSGLVAGRNGPEVFIRSKLEGKTLNLKVGDKLSLGSVEGTVVSIGANYIEVETDGKKWTVGLDESLADAYRRTMKVD
jgi:hypothetical protein